MEVQDLSLTGLSNLPPYIIQNILTLMPMKDAYKTSILSKNWRYHCLNIPKLVFNNAVFQGTRCKTLAITWKLLYVVYPILLLHQGVILEFSLLMSRLTSCCQIDQILLHLSRSATLTKLTLRIRLGDDHKLQPPFFKLEQLEYLELQNCVFQPPVTFRGFSKLVTLLFYNVDISAEVFLQVISNCPLLKSFTLVGDEKHFKGLGNTDYAELFEYLPLVERLCMSWYPIKCFARGSMLEKLPTSLVHLKHLRLQEPSFAKEVDLLSALFFVTSFPNIESMTVKMENNPTQAVTVVSQAAMNIVNNIYAAMDKLDHLHLIKITNFTNMKRGMDFVKFILAKSPMLKKVDILMEKGVDIHDEVRMQKELLRYPRVSARAEISFERP